MYSDWPLISDYFYYTQLSANIPFHDFVIFFPIQHTYYS